jgi:ABC-type Fe3+-hydroxamate transport system substrate-binding protein
VKAYANIEAVKRQRVITLDFSYTAPGARTAAAVCKLAEALYPEKFIAAHIARTAQDPAGVK